VDVQEELDRVLCYIKLLLILLLSSTERNRTEWARVERSDSGMEGV